MPQVFVASCIAMLPALAHGDVRTTAGLDVLRAQAQRYEHGEGIREGPVPGGGSLLRSRARG